MTSNTIYIVAFSGGFKCPRKSISTHSALATTASRALPICESVKGNSGIDQNGFYLPETLLEFVIVGPSDSSKSTSNLSVKFSTKIHPDIKAKSL
jgi:hypothetical protein